MRNRQCVTQNLLHIYTSAVTQLRCYAFYTRPINTILFSTWCIPRLKKFLHANSISLSFIIFRRLLHGPPFLHTDSTRVADTRMFRMFHAGLSIQHGWLFGYICVGPYCLGSNYAYKHSPIRFIPIKFLLNVHRRNCLKVVSVVRVICDWV